MAFFGVFGVGWCFYMIIHKNAVKGDFCVSVVVFGGVGGVGVGVLCLFGWWGRSFLRSLWLFWGVGGVVGCLFGCSCLCGSFLAVCGRVSVLGVGVVWSLGVVWWCLGAS